jgi:uridine phosphorylase
LTFPNFGGKHDHEAIITPEAVISLQQQGGDLFVPDGVVFAYQRAVWDHFDALGARLVDGYPGPWRTMRVLERDGVTVGLVGGFGIGAPVAALILEELIALGVRRFLNIGAAGSLLDDCRFGDVVLADAAIRDEGVSHHYLPAAKFAYPSAALTEEFANALEQRNVSIRRGTTWTIDAVFRETVAEANSYQAEGVATVEMEAAALFAVGALRQVDVAAAFAVSDHLLVSEAWEPGFRDDALRHSLEALLDAAIDTLTHMERPGV